MIVSHKYRFIYIQNRKVAGSSVKACLAQFCGDRDVVTAKDDRDARHIGGVWNPVVDMLYGRKPGRVLADLRNRRKFYGHIPARLVRSRLPKQEWDTYLKFCIERNPWDKTLSYYHMKTSRRDRSASFDTWIRTAELVSDFERYTDRHGNLLVDQVLRYENLTDDLGQLCKRLGIPFSGELDVEINSGFRTDRRCYRDVYTDAQRRIVEQVYAREIHQFGYQF